MPIGLGLGLNLPQLVPTAFGPGAGVDNLLIENGSNLLAEDGTVLKLE